MKRNNFIIAILFLALSSYSYSQTLEEKVQRDDREVKRECAPFLDRNEHDKYSECIETKAYQGNIIAMNYVYPEDRSFSIYPIETIELTIKALGTSLRLEFLAYWSLIKENSHISRALEFSQNEYEQYKLGAEKWYSFLYYNPKRLEHLKNIVIENQRELNAHNEKMLYFENLLLNRIRKENDEYSRNIIEFASKYLDLANYYMKEDGIDNLKKAIFILESISNTPKLTLFSLYTEFPHYQIYSSELLARINYKFRKGSGLSNINMKNSDAFKFAKKSYDLLSYYGNQYVYSLINLSENKLDYDELFIRRILISGPQNVNYEKTYNETPQRWIDHFFGYSDLSNLLPLSYPIMLYENSLESKDFDNVDKAIKIMYEICNKGGIFKNLNSKIHKKEIDIACELHEVMSKDDKLPNIDLMYE